MGLSLRIADAEFSNAITSLTLPDRTGLIGEYLFGPDQASSVVNRAAPGAAALTVLATPVYSGADVIIQSTGFGGDGFDTGIILPTEATVIAVMKKGTNLPSPMGALSGAVATGLATINNIPAFLNGQGAATDYATLPIWAHTDYAFMAGVGASGQLGKLHLFTGGVLATDVAGVVGAARGSVTLKIGGTAYGGTGTANVAYAAIFQRVLSDAEITAAYGSLKTYLATRGVTVS